MNSLCFAMLYLFAQQFLEAREVFVLSPFLANILPVHKLVFRDGKQEWILSILNAQKSDEGTYECQISTEPPQSHKINLFVEGESTLFRRL